VKRILPFLILTFILVSIASGQTARRPTIMVVPSEQYCISRGYSTTFVNEGVEQTIPDYRRAMQSDPDLRLVITKMGGIMADRGFPLKDLEQELRNLERQSAELEMLSSGETGAGIAESPIDRLKRVAQADIILDLDFTINERGPQNWITFNLRGLDAYTANMIAGAAGSGQPSTSAPPDLLLEEAVLSYMDEFNGRLMTHFEDMFRIGRQVSIRVQVWDSAFFDLYDFFNYDGYDMELLDIIEYWIEDNTVEGRYSLTDGSNNFLRFDQVRIPLFTVDPRGRERAMDTRRFVSSLASYLRQNFNIDSHIHQRGLGEAWLILGER